MSLVMVIVDVEFFCMQMQKGGECMLFGPACPQKLQMQMQKGGECMLFGPACPQKLTLS